MKRFLPATFFLLLFIILFLFPFSKDSEKAQAAALHIVISEIQIGKTNAPTDEFIELYNPTNSDVALDSWKLGRKTASGATAVDLVSSFGGTIPSHGYFLIASDNYTGSASADISYVSSSSSVANNNTILLYDSVNAVIDLVGMGTAKASESATIGNPATNKSIERKANSLSTSSTMLSGGSDEFLGNGEDTDNNADDFLTRNIPAPQNSTSAIEPPFVPSPTPTPTPTNTPTPAMTSAPIPTPTATLTPTPVLLSSSTPEDSSSSNSSAATSISCNDSKPGSAPKLLSAEAGINSVFLRWSDASDPVNYHLVAYGLSSGIYQYGNPNVGGKGVTSYTVSGLSAGRTYYFKVRAGNGCTPGDFSNELSAVPLGRETISNLAENFIPGVLGVSSSKIVTPVGEIKNTPPLPAERGLWNLMILSLTQVWNFFISLKFF